MKVALVDISTPAACAVLMAMQADLFPCDQPTNVTEGVWWVAHEGTQRAGFAGLYLRHGGEPLSAYMCLAGVYPAFRGRGLQRRLIAARLKKAREMGLHRLVTDTTPSNAASMNNLIASGFRTFTPADPWKEEGAVYWEKKLL